MTQPPSMPPPAHKEWARFLKSQIPGTVQVCKHRNDDDPSKWIDIFTSENSEGVVAATIGVMDFDQSRHGRTPVHTEILVDCRGHFPEVPNIAATIGQYLIKDGWKAAPGVTFAEMVSMYLPDLEVKHVLFVPPFQWENGMTEVELSDRTVYPLLAVPITDWELELVKDCGADALESKWLERSTDVLDWERKGFV